VPSTRFETELLTRPDDIDLNQHVHSARYLNYVLAARYDQMARCYGFAMEDFTRAGFGWVVRTAHVEYKRPLGIEAILVRTWVDEIAGSDVKVHFQIVRKAGGKLASDGWFLYTMVRLADARAEPIPEWIAAKYRI
jgi:YbgC/YbaW family acyl-CoA thioester hydrolase